MKKEICNMLLSGRSQTIISCPFFQTHGGMKPANIPLQAAKHNHFRYTYGDLIGKCRRMVLLEYFGESTTDLAPSHPCCDVCESSPEFSDQSEEIKAVLHSVHELPPIWRKKGRSHIIRFYIGSQTLDCSVDTGIW
jgi:superfamily II DNA helicase RecQ